MLYRRIFDVKNEDQDYGVNKQLERKCLENTL